MEQRIARRKAALHGGDGNFSAYASYRGGGIGAKASFRSNYHVGLDPRNQQSRPFYPRKPSGTGEDNPRSRQSDCAGDRHGKHGGDRGSYTDLGVRMGGGGGNGPILLDL